MTLREEKHLKPNAGGSNLEGMDLQESVRQMRGMIAARLDDYSLELLDLAIDDEDWESAHGMAVQAAEYHRLELPRTD